MLFAIKLLLTLLPGYFEILIPLNQEANNGIYVQDNVYL